MSARIPGSPPYMQTQWYVAGPMRGIDGFNFPAFFEAADYVHHAMGDPVFNPAHKDCVRYNLFAVPDMKGDVPSMTPLEMGQWLEKHGEFNLREALAADVKFITEEATDLLLLPGWEKSSGARAEKALAESLGIDVWYYDPNGGVGDRIHADPFNAKVEGGNATIEGGITLHDVDDDVFLKWETINGISREVRTTSSTGGQKGTKPERYDLLPYEALDEVARVYAFGAEKYTDNNWRKGYEWGKSLASLFRHAKDFALGHDKDEESGLHPMAHVVFHALALITWSQEPDKAQFDDRYKGNTTEPAKVDPE